MTIFEQAKKDCYATIYSDTPDSVEQQIKAYNKQMDDCRFRKKRMHELEYAFFVANPLIVLCIAAGEAEAVFAKPAMTIAALVVFALGFIKFAVVDQKLLAATAFTALLSIADIRFLILIAADIVIALWHHRIRSKLSRIQGYPAFVDISVTYERSPAPDGYYEKFKE